MNRYVKTRGDCANGFIGGKANNLRNIKPALVPEWAVITADCPDDKVAGATHYAYEVISSIDIYPLVPMKFAVRSSAMTEDGEYTSFAGIFESKLNVAVTSLEFAVREVRDSAKDPRVSAYVDTMMETNSKYPRPNELPQTPAVIIMPMVDAKYSGVLFSTEPVEGTNRMLVEYEEGVGGVVDGESNSKMLFLDKDSYKEHSYHFHQQHHDLHQFYPIYIEAKRLENNYRSPVDIEWAIGKDNTPFILQVRPVTTKVKA